MAASTRSVVLALVFGLLLGFAGGFFAGGKGALERGDLDPILGAGNPVHARSPGQDTDLVAPTVVHAMNSGRETPTTEIQPRAPRISDAELRVLTAKMRVPEVASEVPQGTGTIAGTVTDGQGAGLAGVVVRAQPRGYSFAPQPASAIAGGPPVLDGLEETVRKAAERFARTRTDMREATTDAGGAYRLEGLRDDEWRITAHKLDWVLDSVGDAYSVPIGSVLDFKAERVAPLPIEVLGPDGALVDSAVIEVTPRGKDRAVHYAWTREEPGMRLAPGRYVVAALGDILDRSSSEVVSALRSQEEHVELTAGVAAAPLVMQLAGRGGIYGTIRFAPEVIENTSLRVRFSAVPVGVEPDLKVLGQAEPSTHVRGNGNYAFLDLEPGRYAVGVSRSRHGAIDAFEVVDVVGELVPVDLEVPPLDLSDYLQVRAYGPDGSALSDVTLGFRHETTGGSSSSSGSRGTTTRDGRLLFTIPEQSREAYYEGSAGHSFSIEVRHEEYGSKTAPLEAGQEEVEARFVTPARVEITVAGHVGSGYEGRLTIQMQRDGDEKSFSHTRLTPDQSGRVTVEAVDPGLYQVYLYLRDKSESPFSSGSTIQTTEVALKAGFNSVQVALPTLYSLSVHAPDIEEGKTISVWSARKEGQPSSFNTVNRRIPADDRGRALFEELPAGTYTVRGGGKSREAEVPGGEVVVE